MENLELSEFASASDVGNEKLHGSLRADKW